MKECLSSGSYLHQKHLLYRSTINKEVTSEQNINMAAAETTRRAELPDRTTDGRKSDYLACVDVSSQERPRRVRDAQRGQAEKVFIYSSGLHFVLANVTCRLIWTRAGHACGIDPNISLSVNTPRGPGGFCCWSTSVVYLG